MQRDAARAQRILAKRLPVLAERLVGIAAQDEAQVSISYEMETVGGQSRGHLLVSAADLLGQQFGEKDLDATAPVTRLLHSLSQTRR